MKGDCENPISNMFVELILKQKLGSF